MDKTQKIETPTYSSRAFVNYTPAELRINKQWLVVYTAMHPVNKTFHRFRVNVPAMESKVLRKKYGQQVALEINKKLDNGWLPWYESTSGSEFKTFDYCKNNFLEIIKKDVAKGTKRPPTLKTYTSFFNILETFCKTNHCSAKMMIDFNKVFFVKYMDWMYYNRESSERTYNNHLRFCSVFLNHCINRGYCKENFITSMSAKQPAEKIRQIFTNEIREKLKTLQNENANFYTMCMATYFCFIRTSELTKLKVSDVNIFTNSITIRGEIAKNKKTDIVTIPKQYIQMFAKHLQNANNSDFVFSENNFGTGLKQLLPKKITDTWAKFRKEKNVPNVYQFYSLKDTGITDLLNSGIPALKVRNQARHHDLKITESYTARNLKCDDDVLNSKFDF